MSIEQFSSNIQAIKGEEEVERTTTGIDKKESAPEKNIPSSQPTGVINK